MGLQQHPKPAPGYIRVVCISDTHGLHERRPINTEMSAGKDKPPKYGPIDVPPGDILIHAGDFTNTGLITEVEDFNHFLGKLPHKHKIVIAGNHDLTLDAKSYPNTWKRFGHKKQYDCDKARACLDNCTYLQDEDVTIAGYRIY